ncbi:hypothetical protein DFH08DRAFT_1023486 [Mycena albidolilacea]|uniref:Uncharacterized protein n=1 Tax=Mycena albidolilacea TaxID=1033008 RepID=A0AAD6ZML1_9AGAR|nr:hypothetical protein DFH08DRAFT_1023486 [Mycena albidolilacea]
MSSLGRAAGIRMERTSSLQGVERSRSSVDTLRAVDVGNIDKQRKGANAAILPSRSRVGKDGAGRVHVRRVFAPLSAFTSAPRILPRVIYPSHQFAFYTLGEEYHALIWRYQFAIGGAKIDVWHEVKVSSAYISFASEVFVEGYVPLSSSPHAIHHQSHAAQHPWTSHLQVHSMGCASSLSGVTDSGPLCGHCILHHRPSVVIHYCLPAFVIHPRDNAGARHGTRSSNCANTVLASARCIRGR